MSGRTAVQVRRYGRSFAVLLALMAVGSACGFYILLAQRLPNPFHSFYSVNARFDTAAAVVPGLGEPVNVAGVHVGEITATTLSDGQAIVHMQIDPSKLPGGRVYRDARAVLVPNTPLKDMEVDIAPGSAAAGALLPGATIPASQTTSPIDSDELLGSLDGDTRTWLSSFITELDQGTRGRGEDLRALLSAAQPTAAQLRVVGDLLASRRTQIAQIVHNLGVVTSATAQKDTQLQTVVRAGDVAVGALARQDGALQRAVTELPGTLASTRTTLGDVAGLARQLGPTATALLPSAQQLPATLSDVRTLFEGAALLPLRQIPPFVAAVQPLAAQLPPLASSLRQAIPLLIDSFKVLVYATNELAYNPGGRNPGFLYWIAWFAHNADSFISTSDANGPTWRTLALATCPALEGFSFGPLLEALLGTNFGCPAVHS